MDKLNEYLNSEYLKEKDQHEKVSDIIKKVIPTYGKFSSESGWDYVFKEIKTINSSKKNKGSKSISTSTTAMIAFSMLVIKDGVPDLNFTENKHKSKDIQDYMSKISDNDIKIFTNIYDRAVELLFDEYQNNSNSFKSGTYGDNDPFTLVWAYHLLTCCESDDYVGKEPFKKLNIYTLDYVKRVFKEVYTDRENVEFNSGVTQKIEANHVFPLLKVIQLYLLLDKESRRNINKSHIKGVKNTLVNNLHSHLSLVSIENSNFDTAELVFALEGVLLLDDNKENFDKHLIKRVFEVIKDRQEISMYWRPLKPFVMSDQGLALLPLSVEIAMSLLRICRMLGKDGEKLFSENFEVFNSYTEWLKTRMTIVSCGNECPKGCNSKNYCFAESSDSKKFYGWCSEHVHQSDVIHQWETSQVLIYLVNFNNMLQKHIAYKSFKYANLSIKLNAINDKKWTNLINNEPLSIESFDIYQQINTCFIEGEFHSMLLYGPPGTGKSTIAERIAMKKGWPLVTITPSDFITNGVDQVETKAKSIFKVLEEQENMVVLFDEIDRLILDRDSKGYHKQGDLFQFMTPSMLVKIKDLRTKGKIIFIIATNYEDRIDAAIKRTGRIDKKYLVLPPDKSRRGELFDNKINEDLVHKNVILEKDFILKKTVLYSFIEFDQLLDSVIEKYSIEKVEVKDLPKDLESLMTTPAITLKSISNKICKGKSLQPPYREFLSLAFLKAECVDEKSDFSNDEAETIIKVLNVIVGTSEKIKIKSGEKERLLKIADEKFIDAESLKTIMKEHIHETMAGRIIIALNYFQGVIYEKK